VSYLRDNKLWEEEENTNWDLIEISKVDDKIIKKLITNLDLRSPTLSDKFFISLESLLKLGKRIKPVIESYIQETNEIHNFKLDIFNFILKFIEKDTIDDILIPQLYHPDFIIRARTILRIEEKADLKYLSYILPLLNDPDDSVRWATVKFLDTNNLIKNPIVYKELKDFIETESNIIIKEKAKEIFKNI
jgi:hypothetical protein